MKNLLKVICIVIIACMAVAAIASCSETKPADTTKADTTKEATTTKADETTADTTPVTTEEQTETDPETTTEEITTEADTEPEDQGDVIKIGTRDELFTFAEKVLNNDEEYSDKTIKLTADIDLDPTLDGGKHWTPLTTDMLYDAVIDGDGHVINGMTIEQDDLINDFGTGFIGQCNASLTIKNITFTNALITVSSKHCGCVIGCVENTTGNYVTLENVKVTNLTLNGGVGVEGDTTGISFRVGGLIGANIFQNDIEITNCTVENSKLFGFHNLGGLVGCTIEGHYEFKDNTVKNVELNYSAGYSTSAKYQVPEDIRYFADPFYCVNDRWGEYHTDFDKENGNKYENLDSYDVKFDIHYKDEEGKSADNPGNVDAETGIRYFPAVSNSVIRPRDERDY